MSDFGKNTDTTGGTRYSEGKVVLTWLPWRGVFHAWDYANVGRSVVNFSTNDPSVVMRRASQTLASAMNAPQASLVELGGCLYWLLQLCHHAVVNGCGYGGDPDAFSYTHTHMPALGMWEVGRVSVYGAEKYAEFDWNQGQAFSTLLSSARRHVDKMLAFGPWSVDQWHGDEPPDTKYSRLLHAAHAAWNIACLLDFIEQGRADELDDVSVWHGYVAAQKKAALAAHPDEIPWRAAAKYAADQKEASHE